MDASSRIVFASLERLQQLHGISIYTAMTPKILGIGCGFWGSAIEVLTFEGKPQVELSSPKDFYRPLNVDALLRKHEVSTGFSTLLIKTSALPGLSFSRFAFLASCCLSRRFHPFGQGLWIVENGFGD